MRIVLQNLKSGVTEVIDAPEPRLQAGCLLIANEASLISAGTERMLVEFGRAGLVEKARQQPDKVRQVIDKMLTEGVLTTVDAVRSKLEDPIRLGYSACGRVMAVGSGVSGFEVGQRVVSNGSHAEVVCVPKNLCARVPDGVSAEQAAFTVVGAVALQGVRLASPSLGEAVVVIGLGLIGLLLVQFLRASGCEVIGIDPSSERRALAERFGVRTVDAKDADTVGQVRVLLGGRDADAVLIAASTQSSRPVSDAARMLRKRGRIVLVGVTGLELRREEFYEKELTFQVSCSYGPGRYDPGYETDGHDYPIGFVRWTEQRNFEAVLLALRDRFLDVDQLTTATYPLDAAPDAYRHLVSEQGSSALGLVLRYDTPRVIARSGAGEAVSVRARQQAKGLSRGVPVVGFIGAGNYAGRILVPAFARTEARLKWIASAGGVSAALAARRNGIEMATSSAEEVFSDPEVDAIVIATRHDSHASLVCRALAAGKHVFVEKPLALSDAELDAVAKALDSRGDARPTIMVGFNRRFAPHVVQLKACLAGRSSPVAIIMTVNAGELPASHWANSDVEGGGRIVGEACHFVDLARHIVGAPIAGSSVVAARTPSKVLDDVASISLSFVDGSTCTVHYLSNGHRSYPKERIEVFCGGRVLRIDNYLSLKGWGGARCRSVPVLRQDKGQGECARAFVRAISEGRTLVDEAELLETSRWSVRVADMARTS